MWTILMYWLECVPFSKHFWFIQTATFFEKEEYRWYSRQQSIRYILQQYDYYVHENSALYKIFHLAIKEGGNRGSLSGFPPQRYEFSGFPQTFFLIFCDSKMAKILFVSRRARGSCTEWITPRIEGSKASHLGLSHSFLPIWCPSSPHKMVLYCLSLLAFD